ncbi:hypothetical protein GGTG_01962 [Gaeumannomyces tritici R3-111a-1]|uniref:Uncharacterized protein n=1 Tax=Gaeumannomyces tritici (strain R3-111a-1) TaxID=644352 RepID=J3NL21_GAET3|nr:hypothetical protein GGTG_01962 [Gaeumannomyces tritici R3-111a-1]EJT81988.1 hypothetical protein GGTG_01962 [Gaeumannomyces tritici R3-111a-1]
MQELTGWQGSRSGAGSGLLREPAPVGALSHPPLVPSNQKSPYGLRPDRMSGLPMSVLKRQ